MEEYKKSTRESRKENKKNKNNKFFGSKKHIRISIERQLKQKLKK